MKLNTIRASEVEEYKPGAVRIVKGMIRFRDATYYTFPVSRINTPKKLVGWIHHLALKQWCTTTLIHELIEVVADHFKWNLHSGEFQG